MMAFDALIVLGFLNQSNFI